MDEQFIIDLYQRLALRSPTQAEIDAGLTAIEERGQDAYAQEIGETEEVVEIQTVVLPIIGLYQAFLERTPEPAGLEFWTTAIQNGSLTFGDLIQSFVTTDEFAIANPGIGANPTNEDLVNLFYTNILGRVPDAEGQAFWLSALQTGTIQAGTFTTTFIGSSEVQADIGAALRAYYADVKDGQIDDPANSDSLRGDDGGDGGDVVDPGTGGGGGGGGGGSTLLIGDDVYYVNEGKTVSGDISENDQIPSAQYTLTSDVEGLTLNTDGTFTYQAPNVTNSPRDDVDDVLAEYTVLDSEGRPATGVLTIHVNDVDAPTNNEGRLSENARVDGGRGVTYIGDNTSEGSGFVSVRSETGGIELALKGIVRGSNEGPDAELDEASGIYTYGFTQAQFGAGLPAWAISVSTLNDETSINDLLADGYTFTLRFDLDPSGDNSENGDFIEFRLAESELGIREQANPAYVYTDIIWEAVSGQGSSYASYLGEGREAGVIDLATDDVRYKSIADNEGEIVETETFSVQNAQTPVFYDDDPAFRSNQTSLDAGSYDATLSAYDAEGTLIAQNVIRIGVADSIVELL